MPQNELKSRGELAANAGSLNSQLQTIVIEMMEKHVLTGNLG